MRKMGDTRIVRMFFVYEIIGDIYLSWEWATVKEEYTGHLSDGDWSIVEVLDEKEYPNAPKKLEGMAWLLLFFACMLFIAFILFVIRSW